jgi:hypothetical protein
MGKPEALDRLVEEGVSVGRLTMGGKPRDESDKEQEREDRDRFVVAETAVLLHHVSETLLRLYLAHEGLGACPWLELVRRRDFRAFRKEVVKLGEELGQEERQAQMMQVFYGSAERSNLDPAPPEERWNAGITNIKQFFADYIRRFLDAGLYNAAKHGLAIRPGRSSMQLDDGALLSASGPSVEYLERKPTDDGWQWARSTSWVNLDQTVALIMMACRFIQAIWGIARWRYTDERPDFLILFDRPLYKDIFKAPDGGPFEVEKMQVSLLYYAQPK